MHKPAKPIKRIVSKREYVAQVRAKWVAYMIAIGWVLVLSGCLVGACLCSYLLRLTDDSQRLFALSAFGMIGLFTYGAFSAYPHGKQALREAEQKEIGIPFTRANAADLPALDSLVRASTEPPQAHKAVLLRAATQTSETPAEQWVRPAGGQG